MTDPAISSAVSSVSATNQASVAGAKKALDVQKQEGESVAKLLETAVSTPEGAPGQQVDVTA